MALTINQLLPPLVGPKLKPFRQQEAHVEFIGLLSGITPGKHGYIFKVNITKTRYALKIVNFA